MHYLSSADSVQTLNNRRTNAQGRYYTHKMFEQVFHDIWFGLHNEDPQLFPTEQIILDSALFKASPFHALSEDQKNAEDAILEVLQQVELNRQEQEPTLILVTGAAGTGKTVLLSHLFYRILNETTMADTESDGVDAGIELPHKPDAYILVNHEEQLNVYTQIALKLGLQKKKGKEIVKKPSTFIKNFSVHVPSKTGRSVAKLVKWSEHDPSSHYVPEGKADIVLIDEAHLLTTQGNQGYSVICSPIFCVAPEWSSWYSIRGKFCIRANGGPQRC